MEDHDVVDAVEELGTEVRLERIHDLVLHALVAHGFVVAGEANVGLTQILGTEVARHDQHGVAEVDCAALAVGETAFFENLQQDVEDIGVSFFDFVEQHHAEWLAAHGFGELAALFVSDVSGGRTDEAAHGVLLHVLAHVERDQRGVIAEQELGECLGELGLAHARWAEEDERAAGALGVFETCTRTTNALADRLDGVLLADDALVQLGFHVEQLLRLFFGELVHRDASPQAEHFGDGFFVDFVEQIDAAGLHFGFLGGLFFEKGLFLIAKAAGFFEALFFNGLLLAFLHFGEL